MVCVVPETGFAREVTDRVEFMYAGQLLEVADPNRFFSSARHPGSARSFSEIRPVALAAT
jgi:polar amino acid transport system ATP-binding protein